MTVSLTPLGEDEARQVLALYEDAFPADERRPYVSVSDFLDFLDAKQGKFAVVSIHCNGRFAGFISFWRFDRYVYIEHFATLPQLRGQGVGGAALQQFFDTVGNDVVLEAELPDNDIARRRIGFYRRHGFNVATGFRYFQPPYAEGLESVEMLVMARGDVKIESMDDLSPILREVYGV